MAPWILSFYRPFQDILWCEPKSISKDAIKLTEQTLLNKFGIYLGRFIRHVEGKCILNKPENNEKERCRSRSGVFFFPSSTCAILINGNLTYSVRSRQMLAFSGSSKHLRDVTNYTLSTDYYHLCEVNAHDFKHP